MPLPIILGAAALAASAYATKKGVDGYKKHSEADEIVKNAKARYERRKKAFDEQDQATTHALELLGKKELEIGESIGEFKTLADSLLQKLNEGRQTKLQINIPKHKLNKIENYSFTATGVLSVVAGAGAAGAAAGFAVYGGVMALGAASTGTAISALSGAAATKATLAAIGGGSLAAGGWGIAGGMAVLGAAVAGPVLAITAWAYDSHGAEALKNAHKISNEVNKAIEKLIKANKQLSEVEEYAVTLKRVLVSIFGQFQEYFDNLKGIDSFLEDVKGRNVDVDAELEKFGDEILRLIENGYALASIMVDVITTPIFKPKSVGGEFIKNKDGVPEMEQDADGFMVLNGSKLDEVLEKAKTEAATVEAA